MKIRLLKTQYKSAAENMAIDEAVLEHVSEGTSLPTLRLYGWKPAAISIGYFQSLEEEVDLAACAQHGVAYVRRMTGGGAVLHDDEVTYSMHLPEKAGLVPMGILESYEKICGGIIGGLAHVGLKVKFVPLNDLVVEVGGAFRKISGNAQTRKRGVILQHGTTLLKVDVDKMFSLLKVPSEKLKGKLIEDVKQRVTSVSAALNREFGFDEGVKVIEQGFKETFLEVQFDLGELSESEKKRASELMQEKYNNDAWNMKR